ncbi:MAG: hypothetical protein WKF37_16995 [Bryobacteraceae bacterium]
MIRFGLANDSLIEKWVVPFTVSSPKLGSSLRLDNEEPVPRPKHKILVNAPFCLPDKTPPGVNVSCATAKAGYAVRWVRHGGDWVCR